MFSAFDDVKSEFFSLEGLDSLNHLPDLLHIVLILVLLWVGKKVYDFSSSYSLEHQLVKEDNKAITITFVAYLFGLAIILEGVLEGDSEVYWMGYIEVIVWGLIGNILLLIAGKVNDKILLSRVKNHQELLDNKNLAVAAVEAGSYLASATIIRSILIGDSLGWLLDIGLTVGYFILAQVAFFIYTRVYQMVINYNYQDEVKNNNVAAGISLGLNLVAVGILLSIPLKTSFSIFYFIGWFVIGSTIMAFFRFVMDRVIIPMEKLDEEILKDQNWGIAFLEGSFSIAAVMIIQNVFT